MNPTMREQLRLMVLTTLDLAKPYPLGVSDLRVGLASGFRQLADAEIAAEIDYLGDKGFVRPAEKSISPENKTWTITAAGRDFLALEGLA